MLIYVIYVDIWYIFCHSIAYSKRKQILQILTYENLLNYPGLKHILSQ